MVELSDLTRMIRFLVVPPSQESIRPPGRRDKIWDNMGIEDRVIYSWTWSAFIVPMWDCTPFVQKACVPPKRPMPVKTKTMPAMPREPLTLKKNTFCRLISWSNSTIFLRGLLTWTSISVSLSSVLETLGVMSFLRKDETDELDPPSFCKAEL